MKEKKKEAKQERLKPTWAKKYNRRSKSAKIGILGIKSLKELLGK